MAVTFEFINKGTVTASGGSADITISNIPSTYDDLVLFVSTRNTGAFSATSRALAIEFNGSSSSFSYRRFYGTGGVTGVDNGTTNAFIGIAPGTSATADMFSLSKIYIPDYTSSRKKVFQTDGSVGSNSSSDYEIDLLGGMWDSTSAINSIKIFAVNATTLNLAQYSSATLYGVKKS